MAADPVFRLDRGTPDTLALSGTLSFATAAAALRELSAAVQPGDRSRIDLAGLAVCDSAGLACLLAVLAEARGQGRALSLLHVPEGLRTLARVSGVESLLA